MNVNSPVMKSTDVVEGFLVLQPLTHDISSRNQEAHYNNDLFNQLARDTNDCSNVNSNTLSNVANQIIRPSSVSHGSRIINGGWDEQHISGVILMRTETKTEIRDELWTVYTDKVDLSSSSLAGDTQFIIDSRRIIASSAREAQIRGTATTDDMMNIRPVDIMRREDNQYYTSDLLLRPVDSLYEMQQQAIGFNYNDTRSIADYAGTAARSQDAVASNALSKLINGYRTSVLMNNQEDMGWGADNAVYDDAATRLNDATNETSAAISLLSQRTQFGESGVFTWAEFTRLFDRPGRPAESVFQLVGAMTGQMENARDCHGMHGSDPHTNLVYRINDRMCRELVPRMIAKLAFDIRQDVMGNPMVTITDYAPIFERGSNYVRRAIGELEAILQMELISIVSTYAQVYQIKGTLSGFGLNEFHVKLDDDTIYEPFKIPAFCNSLGTTMVANEKHDISNLAAAMKGVLDDVMGEGENNNLSQNINPAGYQWDTVNQPRGESTIMASESSHAAPNIVMPGTMGRVQPQTQSAPAQEPEQAASVNFRF